MGKLNINNISAGLQQVKSVAESLANISHYELVPLEYIEPAEKNPFSENDDDQSRYEVAMSIQANGLIEPLAVNKKSPEKYTLISGEHRFTAIRQYLSDKFSKVPCMVFEGLTDDEAELKLYEANNQREYTAEQKFRRYQELDALLRRMKESGTYHGAIQKGLAERLGVSTRQIRKYQAVMELPAEKRQAVIAGKISINDASRSVKPKTAWNPEAHDRETGDEKSGTGSAFEENRPSDSLNEEEIGPTMRPQGGDQREDHGKSGTSSAFGRARPEDPFDGDGAGSIQESENADSPISDDQIKTAIKQHYLGKRAELFLFYLFQVPTTQEAISELKPDYGYSGGTVAFGKGLTGDCTAKPARLEINWERSNVTLTYSQVDAMVRGMIRAGEWVSRAQAEDLILKHLDGGDRKK